MSTVIPFKINSSDKLYYNMKDLVSLSPEYFYGCKTRPRTIIKKKNIPNSEYVYANLKKNEWNLSTEDCKKAQLLVTKEWIDKYFFTTIKKNNIENTNDINENENLNIENNENEIDDCEKAPSELFLEDCEKFKDNEGNIIEIEIRGEKQENKIFFKVKDIKNIFNLQSLDTLLLDTRYSYKKNLHYKTFYISVSSQNGITIVKSLYITYIGLIKFLQSTRKNVPIYFINWLNDLLGIQFTHIKFLTPETDTIYSIQKSISTESIPQFTVDKYRIDLYLPEYNIAIECDENNHIGRDMYYEKDRENYIKEKLKCSFIRYDPNAKDFDIFKVIEKINKFIKQTTIEKNLNKEIEVQKLSNENEMLKKEIENEISKREIENEMLKKEIENNKKIYELEKKTLELEIKLLNKNCN